MLVLLIVEEIPTQKLRELGGDSHGKTQVDDMDVMQQQASKHSVHSEQAMDSKAWARTSEQPRQSG